MVATKLYTADDLWNLRDETDRIDLIDGELIRMPGAGGTHGSIAANISSELVPLVRRSNLGRVFANDTGFVLSANSATTLCPDVAFVRFDRLPHGPAADRFLELAPDLAVEIVSPSDSWSDVARKVARYLAAGTIEVWVVDPRTRSIQTHRGDRPSVRLEGDDRLTCPDLLPGLDVKIGDLFPSD